MANAGHKETFTNATAEVGLEYIKGLIWKVFLKSYFHFQVVFIFS